MTIAIRPPYAHAASLSLSAFKTGAGARQWNRTTITGVARMTLRSVHQPLLGSHCHAASVNSGSRGLAQRASVSPTTLASSFWLHFRRKRHQASTALPVAHARDQHQQSERHRHLHFRLPNMENQNSVHGDLAVTTQTASSSATRAFPRPPLPVLAGSSMLVMALLLYYLYTRNKYALID